MKETEGIEGVESMRMTTEEFLASWDVTEADESESADEERAINFITPEPASLRYELAEDRVMFVEGLEAD